MPWLKSAAEMSRNEKIWELSDQLYRIYEGARFFCAENLSDGHVPTSRVTALTPKPATKAQTDALVNRRLWHRLPGLTCKSCIRLRTEHHAGELPKAGYLVHDYLEFNPSKAEWEKAESRRLALASIGGQARAAGPRSGGRFTSRAAGDETSRGTSGSTSRAAGEKGAIPPAASPAVAPASGPAVAPAPYSVLRTPSSGSSDPVSPEDEPFADEPQGADRSRDRTRRGGGLRPAGEAAARVLAAAQARAQ